MAALEENRRLLNDPADSAATFPAEAPKRRLGWGLDEPGLAKAVLGEFVVTLLFLFAAMANGVDGARSGGRDALSGAVVVGFIATALIYSFADTSGAHFNPLVTTALLLRGKVTVGKAAAYIGVQLIAAVVATLLLLVVFPAASEGFPSAAQLAVVAIPRGSSVGRALLMEIALSAILAHVVLATAAFPADKAKAPFAPLAIGLTLGALSMLGGTSSGGAYNPARVFGPAVVTGTFDGHWVYWVGDLAGAAAGAGLQLLIMSLA
ncbi:aquaporin-like protein [Hyaloraphidium curvatum]|nr:aquaporin-like protein [Hyaloraphidium curvatum]